MAGAASPFGPWSHRFTVFTPTYNRADTLPRVFDSLAAQTFTSFEWLVVDDGSSDGTEALLRGYRERAPFSVRYVRQPNGGKHRAWNHALQLADGEIFVPADSDDGFVARSLEVLDRAWSARPTAHERPIAGLICHCVDVHGQLMGDRFPAGLAVGSYQDLFLRHRVTGEKWMAVRTDVAQRYPFPPGPTGRLVPEQAVWHAISRDHDWVLVDEALRVYFTGDAGRVDQLSKLPRYERQAEGMLISLSSVLDNTLPRIADNPRFFVLAGVNYARFALHARRSPVREIAHLTNPRARAFAAATAPIGVAAYLSDRIAGR